MTDPSDSRLVRPCQRVRAGRAPDPVAFPADPWTCADPSVWRRAANDPPVPPVPPRAHPSMPRQRPSVLYGALVIVIVVAIVAPLTLHLVMGR